MKIKFRLAAIFAAFGITVAQPAISQQGHPQPQDMKVDSAVRIQVINGTITRLNDLYLSGCGEEDRRGDSGEGEAGRI